ncbi:hypothetical protein L2755_00555 [Shewanella abyssi]|uniref:hypothetical protein n=1 Tax=Shewanella abyssi TaxID=311789 RepID=UPI00200C60AB|nr:hypothetical protein [Shewanella abyssi]MCL1048120.1 hypothetical protein [Shewanella abyssi]
MAPKPDRITAMQNIIEQVKRELPLKDPETFVCGPVGSCIGCPKKLLELVDSELCYWESAIANGETPQLGDISRFAKLCNNVRRGLIRNDALSNTNYIK